MNETSNPLPPELPRMDAAQYRKMRKLVRECCNYDGGDCLALDECVCVQSISYSLNCKWFRAAVLPLDKKLEAELLRQTEKLKRCETCGDRFVSSSNRAKFCPDCAKKKRLKRQREYMQTKRQNVSF